MKIEKKKIYVQILNAIKKYDKIAIYRHVFPDFDALGTQLGLAQWIHDNFPKKTVKVLGENHSTFTPRLYPVMDIVNDDFFDEKTLSIVVDTGNLARIDDSRYAKGGFVIKIDHHPDVDHYGNLSLVDTTTCAASELIMLMLLTYGNKYKLSKQAAVYFYSGIVGDSGRFLYGSTSSKTFYIAQTLLATGINVNEDVYLKMYEKTVDDLKVTAYLLNNFTVSPKGVAYYTLTHKQQVDLGIASDRGKDNVNLFANIKDIHAWCSISEDIEDKVWRVSIRSKKTPINDVARKYEGGGHPQASGCKLNSITDLPNLIADLDAIL
jgi:phosphoesterase RecJ-like protein